MPTSPTLLQAQQLYQTVPPHQKAIKQRERDARRTTYFCIGYSKAWTTPIWKIIKDLKDKYDLKWLRTSMSYHRFTNLRELFNGDATNKLNAQIISKDFDTLPCNCKNRNDEGCDYCGICRESILVYRVECNTTGKSYIGSTQCHLKKRMQQHFQDVRRRKALKGSFDSCAKHFDRMTINFPNPSPVLLRNMTTVHKVWKGNPLSTVKTFGTNNCILCNHERINIFKWMRTKPRLLINKCSESHGACRHKPKFHRLATALSSTDESSMDEKEPRRYIEV